MLGLYRETEPIWCVCACICMYVHTIQYGVCIHVYVCMSIHTHTHAHKETYFKELADHSCGGLDSRKPDGID